MRPRSFWLRHVGYNAPGLPDVIIGSTVRKNQRSATTIAIATMAERSRFIASDYGSRGPEKEFWVGNGQTQSGGSLFVGDAVNAANAASAIFNDLQSKGVIAARSA
jgi:hypothetical protein